MTSCAKGGFDTYGITQLSHKQQQHGHNCQRTANQTEIFSYDTEDEIGPLFG